MNISKKLKRALSASSMDVIVSDPGEEDRNDKVISIPLSVREVQEEEESQEVKEGDDIESEEDEDESQDVGSEEESQEVKEEDKKPEENEEETDGDADPPEYIPMTPPGSKLELSPKKKRFSSQILKKDPSKRDSKRDPPKRDPSKIKNEAEGKKDSNGMPVVGSSDSNSTESGEKSPNNLDAGKEDGPEKITGVKFVLVYVGLAVTIFLAALDQTIVATTINAIGNEFQAYTQISWVGTAYLLCSAGFGPSWGRLSDVFGRKYTFLTGILLFEIGSAICGAAPNIYVLIFGRAVAGLGGGGIVSLTLIIITDIVSIRDAGKYGGILGAMFGLASVVGPLLGGAFTDHLTWRWAFYINLPLGGVAAIFVWFFLNLPHAPGSMLKKLKRVDYAGSITVMISICLILLGVQWGGATYPWVSGEVLGPLLSGIVIFGFFIFLEGKFAREPIMPLTLFRNRTVIGALSAAVLFGGSFFGLIYFSPIFFQIAHGDSATTAGLQTLPLVLSVVVMAIISGLVVSKTGIYRPFMIAGMIVGTIGCGLVTTWTPGINDGQKIGYLFLVGFGFGWNLQNIVLVSQNAVDIKEVAVITATGSFFRTLGGTAVIAIMQSVFNSKLSSNLEPFGYQLSNFSIPLHALAAQPALIHYIPDPLKTQIIFAFSNAITTSYYVPMAMAVAATCCLFLLENRPLRTETAATQIAD